MYRTTLPVFLAVVALFSISCNKSLHQAAPTHPVKNIVLLIGDGMGLTQVSAAYYFSDERPSFSRFNFIGLQQPTPIGDLVTDSASGATAFSTGYKSYNAAIGVDKDTIARETILEWAAKKGKLTGLVATSSITHATPASFYAHVANREMHEEIAADFVSANVDFAAAGGIKFFNQRRDGKDLLKTLAEKGVKVDTTRLGKKHLAGNRYAYFLGADSLHSIQGGRGNFLPDATGLALDFLSLDEDGFFLLVEGSQIDWGGHGNNAQYLIKEVLDFNKAIDVALDFAEKDGNTLVVVTADHETGGFSLSTPVVFGLSDYGAIKPTFSTTGHTAALIPVFAFGPGAEQFQGVYQNNDLFGKMKRLFKQ